MDALSQLSNQMVRCQTDVESLKRRFAEAEGQAERVWWSQTSRPKFAKVKLVFPDVKFSSYSFFRPQGLFHNRSLTASDIPNSGDGAVHYKTQNTPLVPFLVL